MTIFKQLAKRYRSDTPKFWKKVFKLGLTLTGLSSGLMIAPDGMELPAIITKVAGYAATVGFVLTVVAKATTTNQQLSNED